MKPLSLFIITVVGMASSTALSASKQLDILFPGLPIDASAVYDRDSPEYAEFMTCYKSPDKVGCNPTGLARFYNFSKSKNVDDPFDFANRCVGMRGAIRYAKDTAADGTPTGKGLVLTGPNEIECTGLLDDEVIAAQLLVCFTRVSGAYCSLATVCFQGAKMQGECSKDYLGETAFVSRIFGSH